MVAFGTPNFTSFDKVWTVLLTQNDMLAIPILHTVFRYPMQILRVEDGKNIENEHP